MRIPLAMACVLLGLSGCGETRCKGATCGNDDGGIVVIGCGGACPASAPVCDALRQVCVTCTDVTGCALPTPVCDTGARDGGGQCEACTATRGCSSFNPVCLLVDPGRRCVECVRDEDCRIGGDVCDSVNHRCAPDTRPRDAGVDAGTGAADAGVDGGDPDAGLDAGLEDAGVEDGGLLDGGVCIVHTPTGACSGIECPRGFHCAGQRCALNGGSGPVQVTLRWNTDDDVDLHVLEPTDAGPCDVYYGNTTGSGCGARGQLDLDSNAGCSADHVDIENVIYEPDGGATSGTYEVRVDHWASCTPNPTWVPFEVEVRVNAVKFGYCGAFLQGGPGWDNHGGAGSGRHVMTFVVP